MCYFWCCMFSVDEADACIYYCQRIKSWLCSCMNKKYNWPTTIWYSWSLIGITVSIKVFVRPKIEGYELPPIKWQNVTSQFYAGHLKYPCSTVRWYTLSLHKCSLGWALELCYYDTIGSIVPRFINDPE
jgi:hypothetical protein